jgi:lysozyme family protein
MNGAVTGAVGLSERHGVTTPTRRAPSINFRTYLSERLGPSAGALTRRDVFEIWWRGTRRFEGTLKHWRAQPLNRFDRGGRTNYGITERTFRRCAGAANSSASSAGFERLSAGQAKKIAAAMWRISRADQIADPGVALVVGDWFWGSNTHAWRRIKEALRASGHALPPGDELDQQTIAVLNAQPPHEVIELLSAARRRHHQAIVHSDPSQAVFLEGWQRRTTERELVALELSRGSVPTRPPALETTNVNGEGVPWRTRRHDLAPSPDLTSPWCDCPASIPKRRPASSMRRDRQPIRRRFAHWPLQC